MGWFSWLTRNRPSDTVTIARGPTDSSRRYSSVEIVPRAGACCAAVQSLAGQRFLPEEAPRFPLPDCDQPECDCKYRHHGDRRTEVRRIDDLQGCIVSLPVKVDPDRRRPEARGRRATDRRQK
jgi:hypothetical protein